MTHFVLDASISASWFLPDEVSALSEHVASLLSQHHAWVPTLWRYEMTNIILINLKRGRLQEQNALSAFNALRLLPVVDCPIGDSKEIALLARKHTLTAYDASYLHLAMERQAPLYTLDKQLLRALEDYPALVPAPLAPSPRAV